MCINSVGMESLQQQQKLLANQTIGYKLDTAAYIYIYTWMFYYDSSELIHSGDEWEWWIEEKKRREVLT